MFFSTLDYILCFILALLVPQCSTSSLSSSEISESHGSPTQARSPTIPVYLCVQFLASLTLGRERGPLTRSQQEIVQEGDNLRIDTLNCWLPSCLANLCAASLLISKSDLPLDFFPRPSVYILARSFEFWSKE